MKKQISFTKAEQRQITDATKTIAGILLNKLDKGVSRPELAGTITQDSENREVTFIFVADQK